MNKVICVIFLVGLTSCASTYEKKVFIDTEPPGATAKIGAKTCQTPCDMPAPKRDTYVVQVVKQGYKEEQVQQGLREWEKNPWLVGAAATATIGMLVVWPEMIPVAIVSGLLSKVIPSDDTVHITMTAKEKSE